ncbi:recombinase family protein [Maioricimonas sp. JC845]|uniref:recombinase family protein n=1 Tax=Maioricimonas sp. JC845 TaxID=3232138 RepID=UPI0034585620
MIDTHPSPIRCAVYTRKSTDEGLEQEFNTLDAQREAGEHYILAQESQNWVCLPDRFDDGGFTGGNMERPALMRLMADIEAGAIDCVVVYKVDRLSRSLLDFARIMETFERHGVSFVSVTQQFNTTNSMGRLMLNVLLSFAQFEREIISERTRDKIAATRRKGKWSGGMPLLGYDVDPDGSKLIVNTDEAAQVRDIFALYLEHQSLIAVVQELDRRHWRKKRWTTRKGTERGGGSFTKTSLYNLLTNVTYLGKLRYKDEIHEGEHAAIVDAEVFEQVQATLRRNGRGGSPLVRNKYGALLRGLIHCTACGCSMHHAYSTRRSKRYRYYVCRQAQQKGWESCPAPSVPAGEIERFGVEQIKGIGRDPQLLRQTLEQTHRESAGAIERLEAERQRTVRQWRREEAACRPLRQDSAPHATERLADAQERVCAAERRVQEIDRELVTLRRGQVDPADAEQTLARFTPVWDSLAPREQIWIIQLLIERVDFDGEGGQVSIRLRPTGFGGLAERLAGEGAA